MVDSVFHQPAQHGGFAISRRSRDSIPGADLGNQIRDGQSVLLLLLAGVARRLILLDFLSHLCAGERLVGAAPGQPALRNSMVWAVPFHRENHPTSGSNFHGYNQECHLTTHLHGCDQGELACGQTRHEGGGGGAAVEGARGQDFELLEVKICSESEGHHRVRAGFFISQFRLPVLAEALIWPSLLFMSIKCLVNKILL